jgi:hypothetical protein
MGLVKGGLEREREFRRGGEMGDDMINDRELREWNDEKLR